MKKIICILLFIVFILSMSGCSGKSDPVRMYYYYFNACGSCNESGKFYDMANAQLKGIDSTKYEIITVNVFKDNMPASLKLFLKDNRLSIKDISYPMLTAGNNYIIGQDEIKLGIRDLLKSQIGNSGSRFDNGERNTLQESPKQNVSNSDGLKAVDKSNSYFIYFYTSSCDDCNNTQSYLKNLSPNYMISLGGKNINSDLIIDKKNITQQNNLTQLESFFNYYNVPKDEREVPIMFYSKGYISGYSNIKKNLETVIKEGKALNFDISGLSLKTSINGLTVKSLPGIFLTGLINGLNPCSISMLFLLLSLVVSKQANILKVGFSYVLGKIAAYFSFGVATYSIISLVDSAVFRNMQFVVSILLVILSFVLAFLNFRDAYYVKNERYNDVKMQLPGSLRKYNHKIINYFMQKAGSGWTVVLIFLLGVIISLGEFLCTGQIYVATIVYLFQNTASMSGITVVSFILYVSAISVPLIVLVIIVNKTKKLLTISEFIRKHLPVIKVMFGLTFLVFGLLFLIYTL